MEHLIKSSQWRSAHVLFMTSVAATLFVNCNPSKAPSIGMWICVDRWSLVLCDFLVQNYACFHSPSLLIQVA
jgi:hypothetical protein